jgi:hypothetical protein
MSTASKTFTVTVTAVASGFTADSGYSVSGTVGDMQSLTITKSGGGFGTKLGGGKPWLYLPHAANLNPDTTYSRGTSGNVLHTGCSWSNTTPPPNAAGSLRCLMNNEGNVPGWTFTGTSSPQIYTFTHRRFGYNVQRDGTLTNHKFWRMWTTEPGQAQPPGFQFRSSYNYGSGNIGFGGYCDTDGFDNGRQTYWDELGPLATLTTNWHTFEGEGQMSSAINVADAKIIHWTDGALYNNAAANYLTWNSSYTARRCGHIYFSQIANNVEPADYFYYGPTLIEDSRCRIIVSTESTWNTSATASFTRDFCLPTVWADGQIQVTIRRGIHSSLTGKYLYVVRSDGTAYRIGVFT